MKVLHLIGGGDVGGAKVHVLSLVKELSKHIDVKILSFRPGMFADDARAMGIDIEVIKSGNIIKDIKRVVTIIREGNYQLLHSHGAKANMIAVAAKFFTKLPTVTTVHSDYRLDYLHSFVRRVSFGYINTIALRLIDFYIGVSKNFKEMLIERKFDPKRVFTVYNGIDFDRQIRTYSRLDFAKKYQINLGENDIAIGILARLTPVKDLNTFIDAAREVLKQNPSVKFLIGGDGEERKSLDTRIKSLGLSQNIYLLGYIYEPYEFMANIDINVLTSISESFPYSILEGTMLKKATISSDVGGISDLIDSGINGYLFNSGDYKKLTEYLLELITLHSKRLEMGEKIHQKAREMFSLKNMCKTQIEIYEAVLESKTSSQESKLYYDIIISGYYGFKNIGDDAMLMAITNNLRSLKEDIKIMVLSKRPTETQTDYGVDSIYRFNLIHIFHAMRRTKLFINGGGNLIQDNTSTRSLMYYLAMIWMAKKMGMKVMIYANGIGPINKAYNRKLTRSVLNQVDVITLREESPSKEEVQSLCIRKPHTLITADPALMLDAAQEADIDKIFQKEGIAGAGPYIGLSVRVWKGNEKYGTVIADLADYLIENYGLKPVFIPMHYPSDLTIIEDIVSKMKGQGYIIRNKYSVPETLGIIKRMDMLVGMRLHALIFAASLGVPMVGLVYEPKVEGFLRSIDQASAGHVEKLEFEKLKNLVVDVFNRKDEVREHLLDISKCLKEKAFENAKIAIDLIKDNKL